MRVRKTKRLLAGLLAAVFVLFSLPVGTLAEGLSDPQAASVEVEDVILIEGTNGDERIDYDDETGEEIPYYYYYYSPTVTVTLTDGTVLEDEDGVEYEGEWYPLSYDDGQWETPWEVGVHTVTAELMGVETTFTVEITASPTKKDGFEYISSATGLMITGCNDIVSDTLTLPAQIDGKPVTGLLSLGNASKTVLHVVLPDSVTTIGESAFLDASQLQTVTVGSGVRRLDLDMFRYCYGLTAVNISGDNPYYTDIDGVVYNKAGDTLVFYPLGKGDAYTLPAGVENIDILLDSDVYDFLSITAAPGSTAFVTEDGVTYDAGKTRVIFCDREKAGDYDMPDTVTQIEDKAFSGCTRLTGVAVSENVTDIVYSAFAGCTSLAQVSLPENLQSIEDWAFSGCTVLDGVQLPDSLEQIGNSAFSFSGLTDVAIPDRVEELGPYAFENCTSLQSAALSDGLTSLSQGLFDDCKSLESIAVPQKVTSIGAGAFSGCTSLQSVTLPEGLQSIEGVVFSGCTSLSGIDLPDSLQSIGGRAFSGCTSLSEIDLPDSLQTIMEEAFSGCTALEAIAIPDSVNRLEAYVFERCTSLQSVTLPKGLQAIGRGAFFGCTSLTGLDIPDSVTCIGINAFRDCPLAEVILPQGMTSTGGGYAFSGTAITSLTLPESVTTITYGAFYNCTNLLEIDIPESVVSVGNDAFDGTAWYDAQPDGPVYLEHVFYNYKGNMPDGTALELKDGTTVVADFALENQSGLKSLTLPEGLKTIGFYSLYNCTSLTELYIPASATRIDDFAFAGCSSLASIEVAPDNLHYKSVDGVLFSKDGSTLLWCPKQETGRYKLPAGVEQLSADAFDESGVSVLRAEEPVDSLERDSAECRIYGPYTDEEGVYYRIGYKRNKLELESPDSGVSLVTTEYVLEPGSELVVEPQEVEDLFIIGADNYRLDTAVAFDISLENAGQTVQPNGTVTVSIPVPEGLNGKRCRVLYVREDGGITNMKAAYENGCMVFDTTHFSSYMVAEAEVVYGDVTGECEVTATDALNVLQHVTGKLVLDGEALKAADVDNTPGVSANDALQILQFATAKIGVFIVEE